MNMRDAPPALNWRELELVYPQMASQHREHRAHWSDEAVDHIRSILAIDGYVWAGVTVRLQPTRKGGDPGGFAYSIDYDGKVMLASAVCIDARTADRYWGYASMVKPTRLWKRAGAQRRTFGRGIFGAAQPRPRGARLRAGKNPPAKRCNDAAEGHSDL